MPSIVWKGHLTFGLVSMPVRLYRAARREAGTTPAGEPAVAAKPVVDILEALKKSIAMARKPAASETQPARKTPGRVTEIKRKVPSRKAR